jgi:hypothetical protein
MSNASGRAFVFILRSRWGWLGDALATGVVDFDNFVNSGWARDLRASISGTMSSLGAIGQQIGLGDLGTIGLIVLAMAADPHMLLAAASLVPGLGSVSV